MDVCQLSSLNLPSPAFVLFPSLMEQQGLEVSSYPTLSVSGMHAYVDDRNKDCVEVPPPLLCGFIKEAAALIKASPLLTTLHHQPGSTSTLKFLFDSNPCLLTEHEERACVSA